jgi:hypothetical protein
MFPIVQGFGESHPILIALTESGHPARSIYPSSRESLEHAEAGSGIPAGQDPHGGKNWLTRKFPGAGHSERSWRKRADVPLEFLLREAKEARRRREG